MKLYRPVGLYELAFIAEAAWRAYPPRLPEQPIFYPVLNQPYAEEIAFKWNPSDPNSGFAGFVTVFEVPEAAVAAYPVQVVGASHHQELWVPAEEQAALEADFAGPIAVVKARTGSRISEVLPGWNTGAGLFEGAALQRLVEAVVTGPVVGGPLTEGR